MAASSLIIASIIFYSVWNIYFVPMLAFAVISNYVIARQLEATGNRAWFYFGIVLALIPITYFKYSGLFVDTAGIEVQAGLFGEKLGSLLRSASRSTRSSKSPISRTSIRGGSRLVHSSTTRSSSCSSLS